MEIIKIEDQEDGSGLLTLDLSDEEISMLVECAVNDILKKEIEKEKPMIKIYEEDKTVVDVTMNDFKVRTEPYKYYKCVLCGNKQEILEGCDLDDFIKIQTCVICNKIICNRCKRYYINDKELKNPVCLEHREKENK